MQQGTKVPPLQNETSSMPLRESLLVSTSNRKGRVSKSFTQY